MSNEEKLNKIINFIELIHPFLKEDTYKSECIEIRAIGRQKYLNNKNLNLWRINDKKAQQYFEKFFVTSIDKPYCLYYSVFSLDYNKKTYRSDGAEYQKGYINNQNSIFTQILIADFDNIQLEEYLKYYNQFLDIGIEPITIFTGHGYQLIILLKEKCYDQQILKLFNQTLAHKGFPIDEQIIDSARIMRLPYTYNNKEFDENNSYYTNNPLKIETYIVHSTKKRYFVEDVFTALGKSISISNSPNTSKTSVPRQNTIIPKAYNIESFNKLPTAIQNMLAETKEGFRNSVLLFLVPYFRNYENLSVNEIKDILSVWATRCKPALDIYFVRSEVERLLNYEFKGKCGKYSDKLKREFGDLNLDAYFNINVKTGDVVFPNTFFKLYDSLHPCSIKIYLALKVKEHLLNKKEFTMDEISQCTGIAVKTLYKYLPELVKFSLLYHKKACRKTNTPSSYILPSKYDFSQGYTLINAGVIENMIFNSNKSLLDTEIKVVTYFYFMVGSDKKECWISVRQLSNKINISYNRISELTSSLNDKEYLIKETYIGEDGNHHSRYKLNYVSQQV